MAPIGIKYFKCINNGVGIIIYPQLRGTKNPSTDIVWDGREVPGYKYMTTVGQATIVNLEAESVPQNTPFYLSENTVFGNDYYSTEQSFVFDPNSNLIAIGQRWGPSLGGSFEYLGTKPYNPNAAFDANEFVSSDALSVAAAIFEVLSGLEDDNGGGDGDNNNQLWDGLVQWASGADPNIVIVALAFILAALIHRGYQATYKKTKTTATFTFGPKGDRGVPPDVKKDWDNAVASAAAKFPQIKLRNDGVKEHKKSKAQFVPDLSYE